MTINTLSFLNPTFNDGVNLTVRHGTKWLGVPEALIDLGSGMAYLAQLHTRSIIFNKLTDADLQFEHDPECRSVTSLKAVLEKIYPDFKETDTVTLVTFLMQQRVPAVGDNLIVDTWYAPLTVSIDEVIPMMDGFYEVIPVNNRNGMIVHESQFTTINGVQGWYPLFSSVDRRQ